MVSIYATVGALLIGGIVSFMLSGAVWTQTVIYMKLYGKDPVWIKLLVFVVWLLDGVHTGIQGATLWFYLIDGFGNVKGIDIIPTSLGLTIIVNAVLTFIVQIFFVHRIFILSKNNYYIAVPLALVTAFRPCFAAYATSRIIMVKSLHGFSAQYAWTFTVGLSLSAIGDILITGCMCFLLKRQQKKYSSMNKVLDTLILYALENGLLPAVTAFAALVAWLTMKNMIFVGIHFTILKLYANCLLATLNARQELKTGGRITMHTTNLGGAHNTTIASGETDTTFHYTAEGGNSASEKLDINTAASHGSTTTTYFKALPLTPAATNFTTRGRDNSEEQEEEEEGGPRSGTRRMFFTRPGAPRYIAQPIVLGTLDASDESATATRDGKSYVDFGGEDGGGNNAHSRAGSSSTGVAPATATAAAATAEWDVERGLGAGTVGQAGHMVAFGGLERVGKSGSERGSDHKLKIKIDRTQASVLDQVPSVQPKRGGRRR